LDDFDGNLLFTPNMDALKHSPNIDYETPIKSYLGNALVKVRGIILVPLN